MPFWAKHANLTRLLAARVRQLYPLPRTLGPLIIFADESPPRSTCVARPTPSIRFFVKTRKTEFSVNTKEHDKCASSPPELCPGLGTVANHLSAMYSTRRSPSRHIVRQESRPNVNPRNLRLESRGKPPSPKNYAIGETPPSGRRPAVYTAAERAPSHW